MNRPKVNVSVISPATKQLTLRRLHLKLNEFIMLRFRLSKWINKNVNRSSPTCSFPACCELLEFQLCRENIKYVSTLHVNFHKSTHYISYHGLLHVCTNKYFTAKKKKKAVIAHPHVISNTFFFQETQKIGHAVLTQIKTAYNNQGLVKLRKQNI